MGQREIGILITYITMLVNIIAGFLYTPYMISHLGASEYGIFSLSSSLISFVTLLDLGFNQTMVRYIAKYKAKDEKVTQNDLNGFFMRIYLVVAIFAIIIGILLLTIYPLFCSETFTPQELRLFKIVFFILLVNIVVSFPMSIFDATVNAYERFIYLKMIALICIVIKYICIFLLLYMGFHLVSIALVTSISAMAVHFFNMVYCKQKLDMRFSFGKLEKLLSHEIYAFSALIFINLIVDFVFNNTDKLLLGVIKGTSAVSIYTIGTHFFIYYQELSVAISGVFLPRIVMMYEREKDVEKLSDLFLKVGKIQLILLALVLSGFFACGNEFIWLWVGDGFYESYIVGLLFMIPALVSLSQNLGISILRAMNIHKYRAYVQILMTILNLVLSIPLAIRYGATGAAIGTFISTIFGQVLMNWCYMTKVGLNILRYWRDFIRLSVIVCFVLALMMSIKKLFEITRWEGFLAYVLTYTIIYFLSIWSGYLNKNERKNIVMRLHYFVK